MRVIKIPAEVYSRVSGYYRPVKQWNKGKQSEFDDRKVAHINISVEDKNVGRINSKGY